MSTLSAMRLIVALVLAVGVVSVRQTALAQVDSREGIALQNQILDLRRQMQALQDQASRGGGGSPTYLGRGGSPPPGGANDLVAQLLARVDTLEEQVRQLRGRTDETANQVQRMGADLSKRIEDQAFQSQNSQEIGQPPRVAPPSAQPPQFPPSSNLALTPPPSSLGGPYAGPRPQPGSPAVPRTPEVAMQEGNAALGRRDYQTAEQAAREVLTSSRTSPRAYDAQFLLAQALLGERQFPQAAIAYDDTYNRARKGAHAQDAMLGLANSLIAINEKKAACDTLVKLRTEFPSPRPDLRDAIGESTQRAGGCR
ncbi:MAG TPA: tetratricopeptide repeat protein [Acetobacteraceae bacterium]|jgi:TolA-binding protein|nr:tetratricopeptide repeat protein [Acetobacteraceae bacterium]